MIQLLFTGIFVSVDLPILLAVWRERELVEARLNTLGLFGKGLVILLLLPILFASVDILPKSFQFTYLINTAVFEYLILIPIHETGHFLLMPFGRIPCVFGGSFFEVGLPFALSGLFIAKRFPAVGCIFLFIVGRNLTHVGDYMSSARHHEGHVMLALEQDPNNHDWYILFQQWGLLDYDTRIGQMVQFGGVGVMVIALAFLFILNRAGSNGGSQENSGTSTVH